MFTIHTSGGGGRRAFAGFRCRIPEGPAPGDHFGGKERKSLKKREKRKESKEALFWMLEAHFMHYGVETGGTFRPPAQKNAKRQYLAQRLERPAYSVIRKGTGKREF